MFKKTPYDVLQQNDQVVLRIGNADITMAYEDAIVLGQKLRYRGKQAKAFAGDISRHWSVIAVLGDAETHEKMRLIR